MCEFGSSVVSRPLMVELIETLFVPLLVNNRRKSQNDKEMLEKFCEPYLNNPVVRFVTWDGADIIPRRDGLYWAEAILDRMILALRAHPGSECPKYLEAIRLHHAFQDGRHKQLTFPMPCYGRGDFERDFRRVAD